MSVEKKYLASNPELNTVAISHLRYVPGVSGAEAAVKSAAAEMKRAGMLKPDNECSEALAKRAFAHLDGVTDQWLEFEGGESRGRTGAAGPGSTIEAELAATVGEP